MDQLRVEKRGRKEVRRKGFAGDYDVDPGLRRVQVLVFIRAERLCRRTAAADRDDQKRDTGLFH